MIIAILISFTIFWPVQEADSCAVYRNDTLIAVTEQCEWVDVVFQGAQRYHVARSLHSMWSGPSNTVTGVYLDWSQGAHILTDTAFWLRDSTRVTKITLPAGKWDIYASEDSVIAWSAYDFNRDGAVDLSDLTWLGLNWQNMPDWNLSKFSEMGNVYNRKGCLKYVTE